MLVQLMGRGYGRMRGPGWVEAGGGGAVRGYSVGLGGEFMRIGSHWPLQGQRRGEWRVRV